MACSVGGSTTYRDETDASLPAEPVHLALFLPVQETVVVLHGNKLCPAVFLCDELQIGKLIGPHRARPDVADFAALNQVVKRLHDFLGWGIWIIAVNLKQINVVRPESLERSFDLVEDGGA